VVGVDRVDRVDALHEIGGLSGAKSHGRLLFGVYGSNWRGKYGRLEADEIPHAVRNDKVAGGVL
jgi:hypothetical protein